MLIPCCLILLAGGVAQRLSEAELIEGGEIHR
jgi:hypothetical protein